MAVFTELDTVEASRISRAHGLGETARVTPIAAGSVNSNFFVDTAAGTFFLRIYEEQDVDGVAYEWALVDHLRARGLAVAARAAGPEAGALRVQGKPVALFEIVGGAQSCQRAVTQARAREVGRFLARAHDAGRGFPLHRAGRFGFGDIAARIEVARTAARPELDAPLERLERALEEAKREWPNDAPIGVIHGDLFRDNVHWGEGDRIVAVLDWESASDGVFMFDVMVAVLAWTYDDALRWDLARALVRGYREVRELDPSEWRALRPCGIAAAARFSVTRITDFYLRSGAIGARVQKDYRRFLSRLEELSGSTHEELAAALT